MLKISRSGISARLRQILPLLILGLVVLSAKFLLIAQYGVAAPVEDQWASEGYFLFVPFLQGNLTLLKLLAAHNEHHIVMTRLLDLALLELNHGVWNPLLEMVANALVHVAALLLLMHYLGKACAADQRPRLLLFAGFVAILPFDYINTLSGFQGQMYFCLLFTVLFLWSLCHYSPFSGCWWLGIACGWLSYYSFGSGVATLAAGILLLLLRQPDLRRDHRRQGAVVLLACLTALAIVMTPPTPQPLTYLQSGSPLTIVLAGLRIASWPAVLPLALLLYLPLLRFMWRQLRQRPVASHPSWFVFAMGLWMLLQIALIAYGRSNQPLAARYLDFFAVGVLLNACCLLKGVSPAATTAPGFGKRAEKRWRLVISAWLLVVVLGLLARAVLEFGLLVNVSRPLALAAEQNVRAYLYTGNAAYLRINVFPEQPLNPRPETLQLMLGIPELHQLLPPGMVPENAARQASWVSGLLNQLRTLSLLLLTLGLGLMLRLWLGAGAGTEAPRHRQTH
jgi:hypothetical protein